jgi:circadian clock protein KaiC
MNETPAPGGADEQGLEKCPTGIQGLDEVTEGGLPRGRPTLVCGGPGCGKTLLAMEFLVRGATQYDEPGVFLAFEETAEELARNVHSLGFDLKDLAERNKLKVSSIRIERSEIEETGEYDLEGLFIRLGTAIEAVKARRVVLDTIETIFSGLSNTAILRSELRRLFRWLKDKKVTAIITGERGVGTLTQYGLEEYVSDCVILLDHRVTEQVSTRRLRIVKYRGSSHGTNEFPFLIDKKGISVVPITSLGLAHDASTERISTGIPRLDTMFGGEGYFRGSSVLVSGTAGTGKTSVAAYFADAACRRGERCLFFTFEESPSQILRNMRSLGLDLEPWVRKGLLRIEAGRPSQYGLETHLAVMHHVASEFRPQSVVVDPISNFLTGVNLAEVNTMLVRLIDLLKSQQITAVLTNLTKGGEALEQTEAGISSLIDTWVMLQDIPSNGERNRGLSVIKSRGMAHSNQIREFVFTSEGIQLRDVYVGPAGVLAGSARLAQEAQTAAASVVERDEAERKRRALERRTQRRQARIAALQAELRAEQEELERMGDQQSAREDAVAKTRMAMGRSRMADTTNDEPAAEAKGDEP